jgi:hypothetical protein
LLYLNILKDTHTLGMTPLDEGSACHSDFYLTTHHVHKKQTSIPRAGFEQAIPAAPSSRPRGQRDRQIINSMLIFISYGVSVQLA